MSSGSKAARDIVTVHSGDDFDNRQRLNLFDGISDRTCGSRGIPMYKVGIPADVPHQPVNIGTGAAEAIGARNDASEQENVAPYDVA